jgi:hypothetical protein
VGPFPKGQTENSEANMVIFPLTKKIETNSPL